MLLLTETPGRVRGKSSKNVPTGMPRSCQNPDRTRRQSGQPTRGNHGIFVDRMVSKIEEAVLAGKSVRPSVRPSSVFRLPSSVLRPPSLRPCVRASVRPCVRASVRPCVRASVRPSSVLRPPSSVLPPFLPSSQNTNLKSLNP